MAAVTAALIGFFGFVIVRFSQPPMATLYADLALQDSAAIVKDLERAGVAYELRGDGSTVLVPKADVARLRMKMAEAGLPRGGSVGYEIFDKSDALGTTSFVQNINQLRALEGELARTIGAIERIQQARVHLVIPERALFSRDKLDPSASIALRVQGELDPGQIRAIRHLVASAVQGLKPERVSIVDEAGRLLADGAGDDTMTDLASDERTAAYERRIKKQIEEIVSSVAGHGRARVQVNAEFDFNRITQTSDSYDPESRVVRSTQTREESQVSTDANNGQVSVANEVPNPAAQGGATPVRDQSKKSEETVNYEISRTTRTEVVEGGRIKRVSVAVVVDGTYARDGAGNVSYTPRTNEEIDRITALVRSAIGFDQKRGDQVEVVNLRFAEGPPPGLPADEGWLSQLKFGKEDIMQAAETGVFLFLTLIVLLMVVRPMVRRILASDEEKEPAAAALSATAQLPAADSPPLSPEELKESETARKIAYAKIQGQLHAQSIAKVGELVDQNPQETVGIIRQWMQQDATP
nr:flagellar basal-body MS-ring/collar protein FliF [Blastochloris sulfoviridis]